MSDVPIPDLPPPDPADRRIGRLHRLQPLLAIAIALVAIGLAAWEGLENRRHNRLMVQPRLGVEVGSGRDDQGEYAAMAIASTGLGPAVVRSFRVYLDGSPQETPPATNNPWSGVVEALTVDEAAWEGARIQTHAFGEGYFLAAGSEHILFEARRPERADSAATMGSLLERIAVDICYCSIYGTDCDRALVAIREVEVAPCPR